MVCDFELAVWAVGGVGRMVESAVGQGTAEPFVEKQEEQGHLNALGGEPVGIAGAIAFEQAMAL